MINGFYKLFKSETNNKVFRTHLFIKELNKNENYEECCFFCDSISIV